ncbi:hypothetical protein BC477_18370 [Clavibacter michiganensis subsp. michiganensis]|uniref:Uncharacterized protein n=1 Tax=Clavibacter michiganensis subsp. michiganensis TaxID=33013 RepID=A0A251XFX2_CLAMM|nr:hypothetical protein BC477_18370 [Clavibacter michiganensis subsp. michiganensis]OUE01448.1 hypothetical protein CMMCAS07_14155 [Clavibacter michiganensis subsp. michiganensis]
MDAGEGAEAGVEVVIMVTLPTRAAREGCGRPRVRRADRTTKPTRAHRARVGFVVRGRRQERRASSSSPRGSRTSASSGSTGSTESWKWSPCCSTPLTTASRIISTAT